MTLELAIFVLLAILLHAGRSSATSGSPAVDAASAGRGHARVGLPALHSTRRRARSRPAARGLARPVAGGGRVDQRPGMGARTLAAKGSGLAVRARRLPDHPSIRALIRRAFPDDPDTALCIAARESTGTPGRFNPRAVNGTNVGLMQIEWSAHPWVNRWRLFDPVYNLRVARRIYLAALHQFGWAQRWRDWTTRSLCGA